jgi:hypothetical protein
VIDDKSMPATEPKPPRRGAVIEFEELSGDIKIHKNLTRDIILTTEDKLRLVLIGHRDILATKREWIAAGSLALSLLTTILLTSFEDKLGLSADVWQAAYAFFFVLAFVWLISSLVKLFKNRRRGEIDFLIKQIKEMGQRQG